MTGISSIRSENEQGHLTVSGGIPQDSLESLESSHFLQILQNSAREALRSALGDVILGILTGQNMLKELADATEFTDRLRVVFGASGAKTLQFVIVKELYKRLNLSFEPDGSFDYATLLQIAKSSFSERAVHK